MANNYNNGRYYQQQQPAAPITPAEPEEYQEPVQPIETPVEEEEDTSPAELPGNVEYIAPQEDEEENQDKVPTADITEIVKQVLDAARNDDTIAKNRKLFCPSVPLGTVEEQAKHSQLLYEKHKDDEAAWADATSPLQNFYEASRELNSANELSMDALKKIPEEKLSELKASYKGVGDSLATAAAKLRGVDTLNVEGEDALLTSLALLGGVRRITLWNSGLTLTLRNLNLNVLSQFYTEINHTDYEYGREYGMFYYLFADLKINEYIINRILPLAIGSSNYVDWKKKSKLWSQISMQDFHTILWALAVMMHPHGTNVNFTCPSCGEVNKEKIDLTKLKLLNRDLLNEYMAEHFKKGTVTDEDMDNYRKVANLDRTAEFSYSEDGEFTRKFKVVFKQANLGDYLSVARDFNSELEKSADIHDSDSVNTYMFYNNMRMYKPWIKSISFAVDTADGEKWVNIENTGTADQDKAIFGVLNEFQMNYPEFADLVKDYILDTKITHIAYYYPKCPHCGKEPSGSYHGYIPYDPAKNFFTLALTKMFKAERISDQKSNNDIS